MNITFFQDDYFEYSGVMSLIAVLERSGHRCEVIIERNPSKILKRAGDCNTRLAAFSCIAGVSYRWSLKLSRMLKGSDPAITTVFGGPQPTFFPEIIKEESIDIVCVGEGEYPLLELADALEAGDDTGNIPNLWIKRDGEVVRNPLRPLITDLDGLPFMERRQYYSHPFFRHLNFRVFTVGRGCPYNCSFCYNRALKEMYHGKGSYVRLRDPSRVIREIGEVKERYGVGHILFTDDSFGVHKRWLKDFLRQYRDEVDIPFTCCLTAGVAADEDIVKALGEAGCSVVCFGIESGDEGIRRDVLKKPVKDSEILEAARLLREYGIGFLTFNMLGIPGEGLEEAMKTVMLNRRISATYPRYSILTPYPKTGIADYAIMKGLLNKEDVEGIDHSYFRGSIIRQGNIKRLINLQKLAFYFSRLPIPKRLIRLMVRLPGYPLYHLLFLISYAYIMKGIHRMRYIDILRMGWHSLRQYRGVKE